MFSDDINIYSRLWENPSHYILVTVESTPYVTIEHYKKAGYVAFAKLPLGYAVVSILPEAIKPVIEKMIEAGVEIRKQPLVDNKDFKHLLVDKSDEFALIRFEGNSYGIYHKEIKEYLTIGGISEKEYRKIIEKMIKAGVEIWDKRPEKDSE